MELLEILEILAASAKYNASYSSNGSNNWFPLILFTITINIYMPQKYWKDLVEI